MQSVKEQLIPRIKALCPFTQPDNSVLVDAKSLRAPRSDFIRHRAIAPRRSEVVVIGSSTGGPQALAVVLGSLPASFPVPIVIVQHMPPVFTRHLANRLNQESRLTVKEAEAGDVLHPGHALIAPGGHHLDLVRQGIFVKAVLHDGPPENSCRPAVDVLFRSAANVFGSGCVGVVLTGMGQDGLRGAEFVVNVGGSVIAQDEDTSVVWGMPRAVTQAGLASRSLPLSGIAQELLRVVALGRRTTVTC